MSDRLFHSLSLKSCLLLIILVAGAFFRFYKLGALPIDGDNSFQALAVQGILQTGKPEMPSGLLYLRAVPLLYLEALSAKLFGFSEWSLALPNACIGTLNVLLIYLLVKSLLRDSKLALVASLLFAVSPWAVAVARMPRMYEPFLMASLLSWFFFFKWYYERKPLFFPLLLISSLLTLSLHDSSILPLLCFLVPLLIESRPQRHALFSAACFPGFALAWFFLPRLTQFLYFSGS
jgi:4-amino-4-deoxy-L-arabinose transferase-like glycosyltransferase